MRLFRIITIAIMLLLATGSIAFPVTAQAQTFVSDCVDGNDCEEDPATEQEPLVQANSAPTIGSYIKVVFAFAFVIFLLYFLLKFVNRRNQQFGQARLMRNLGGVSVGPQKSVQLLSIGGRYYLIVVGDDVRLLKEIETEEELESIRSFVERESDDGEEPSMLIIDQFKRLFEKKRKPSSEPKKEEPFDQLFQQELDKAQQERKAQMEKLLKEERERRD